MDGVQTRGVMDAFRQRKTGIASFIVQDKEQDILKLWLVLPISQCAARTYLWLFYSVVTLCI
jgi:hypothetical protein